MWLKNVSVNKVGKAKEIEKDVVPKIKFVAQFRKNKSLTAA